jgi:hypothetical protein
MIIVVYAFVFSLLVNDLIKWGLIAQFSKLGGARRT